MAESNVKTIRGKVCHEMLTLRGLRLGVKLTRVDRGKATHACTYGGAGAPCPWCNVPDKDEAPRVPDGFKTEFDEKGWRH
jgi:hypothetical protein